jgi:hypothetical protein
MSRWYRLGPVPTGLQRIMDAYVEHGEQAAASGKRGPPSGTLRQQEPSGNGGGRDGYSGADLACAPQGAAGAGDARAASALGGLDLEGHTTRGPGDLAAAVRRMRRCYSAALAGCADGTAGMD